MADENAVLQLPGKSDNGRNTKNYKDKHYANGQRRAETNEGMQIENTSGGGVFRVALTFVFCLRTYESD